MSALKNQPLSSTNSHLLRFGILGGGALPSLGTFSEYVVVERNQVVVSPDHLNNEQVAAWPVGGVTAWRFVSNHYLWQMPAFSLFPAQSR